jgi:hypothetical protein
MPRTSNRAIYLETIRSYAEPLVLFVLACVLAAGYAMNVAALFQCDFERPYNAEVIRGTGVLVAPAGAILGWATLDDTTLDPEDTGESE